jgi:multidrug resistance efflux pump
VQTPSAVIDIKPLALGTQVHAQVTEVLVKKNEHVAAGQALIRFITRTGTSNAAEAGAQVAAVRNLLPSPAGSMEEVARRVAAAQSAEQDLARRITQARVLEEEATRDVQRKAEDHAKAQLELRRLDALGAQYSVPAALHDQARNNEYKARQQLEKARATREEHSRARAATEGELYRIKTELTERKSVNTQVSGIPDQARKAAPQPPQMPAAAAPDIVAPTDAVVAEVFAQPGMWAQPHQQLIVLAPGAGSLEATAWFPEKDGANIQPGQICRVFILESPEKSYYGNVEQVLPADSLAPKFPLAAPAQMRHVPVRIRFSGSDAGSHAALKSGMRAAVRVHTVTPPPQIWARINALTGKIRGK